LQLLSAFAELSQAAADGHAEHVIGHQSGPFAVQIWAGTEQPTQLFGQLAQGIGQQSRVLPGDNARYAKVAGIRRVHSRSVEILADPFS